MSVNAASGTRAFPCAFLPEEDDCSREAGTMTESAPRSFARATGLVYLAYFTVAISGLILVHWKMVPEIVANSISNMLYAATTLLLYRLFRRADGALALVAAALSLLGCATDSLEHFHLIPAAVSPLLFFALFCILLGALVLRSRFLPGWLGWPLVAAGVGWLAYLVPAVALYGKFIIFPLGFVAEFELMLWLMIKGVDEPRWSALPA